EGVAAFQNGGWANARDWCERATLVLRERCTGVAWELDTMQLYGLICLGHLGELRRLTERLPALVQEARERGDLYAETCFRTRVGYLPPLAAGDAHAARREVRESLGRWSQGGLHVQHFYA